MKALLKAANAAKTIKAKAQAETQHARISKADLKMRDQGIKLVEQQIADLDTARDRFLAFRDHSAEQIAQVRFGVKDAWVEVREHLGSEVGEKQVKQMSVGSIYNRASENDAILMAMQAGALLKGDKRKKFCKMLDNASSYHSLVSVCRTFNAEKRGAMTDGRTKNNAAKRERTLWSKQESSRVQTIKKTLRFAPLSALEALAEYIDQRITQEKRSNVQRKAGEQGTVAKLRRAA